MKEITNESEAVEELQLMESDVKDLVIGAFAMSPRFMFEFLDAKSFVVVIGYKEGKFSYSINDTSGDNLYLTRLEAEKEGFKHAIKILEKTLSDGKQ